MSRVPARGLPVRIYLPILLVLVIAVVGVVWHFLTIAFGTTGAALGPAADSGSIGGAPGNGVGGGTVIPPRPTGPPAGVQRMLTELKGRLVRNPNDSSALIALAQLYADAGKFEQALPYYRRAVAVRPSDPPVRTAYATALHATGNDTASLEQLESALKTQGDFSPALYERGVVDGALGRRSEAIDAFRRYLAVAPNGEHADDARTALQNLGA